MTLMATAACFSNGIRFDFISTRVSCLPDQGLRLEWATASKVKQKAVAFSNSWLRSQSTTNASLDDFSDFMSGYPNSKTQGDFLILESVEPPFSRSGYNNINGTEMMFYIGVPIK